MKVRQNGRIVSLAVTELTATPQNGAASRNLGILRFPYRFWLTLMVLYGVGPEPPFMADASTGRAEGAIY